MHHYIHLLLLFSFIPSLSKGNYPLFVTQILCITQKFKI